MTALIAVRKLPQPFLLEPWVVVARPGAPLHYQWTFKTWAEAVDQADQAGRYLTVLHNFRQKTTTPDRTTTP